MGDSAPESVPLWMMQGHSHAMTSHWEEALHEYKSAWLHRRTDPLPPLCIAVTLLCLALSRKVRAASACCFGFFSYPELSFCFLPRPLGVSSNPNPDPNLTLT